MKLLITGCNGQLGRELFKQLKNGYAELGSIPERFAGAKVTGVDLDDYDLADRRAVREHILDEEFDVVINCAAYTNVDGCETEQDAAYKANVIAVRNLAEACDDAGAKLVHVSTDYVFSGDACAPYREYDLPNPQSVYGKTKLAGEQAVRESCRRHFIVRTQWLYGYYGRNFVKTIMNAARINGAVKVVNDQFGCPTNAVDLAYHLLRVAAGNRYGVYHCVNQGVTTWYAFTQEILRLAGINATVTPCTTDEFPHVANRPAYSPLDNMMLRLTVGDEMRRWQDALAMFLANLDKEIALS